MSGIIWISCFIVSILFALAITALTGAGPLAAFFIGMGCGAISSIVAIALEGF